MGRGVATRTRKKRAGCQTGQTKASRQRDTERAVSDWVLTAEAAARSKPTVGEKRAIPEKEEEEEEPSLPFRPTLSSANRELVRRDRSSKQVWTWKLRCRRSEYGNEMFEKRREREPSPVVGVRREREDRRGTLQFDVSGWSWEETRREKGSGLALGLGRETERRTRLTHLSRPDEDGSGFNGSSRASCRLVAEPLDVMQIPSRDQLAVEAHDL